MSDCHIYHNSHEETYRKPFGAVACGCSVTIRLKVTSTDPPRDVSLRLVRGNEDGFETRFMYLVDHNDDSRLYETRITAPPAPGLLWYYFTVTLHGQVLYYGNNRRCLGGKGQVTPGLPPAYQITVYAKDTATPGWFKEVVIYQIYVDRFYNGNADGKILNPKEKAFIHAHWEDSPFYVRDIDTGEVARWDFFGGNLAGVRKKLPYLQELGVKVIYFNPIFLSPSNHKYDTADYKQIDPMYGDNEEFRLLCEQAAEMGIHIILDGVFSHTGSDSIYFNKKGNYPSLGAYQSPESPYYTWYRFNEYPDKYESWWGIDTLPNVNELEPSYQDFILHDRDSVVRHWMRLGAKGWRLDVADELPDQFIKKLRRTVKDVDAEAVIIGEVWEDASNKISYGERREYLLGDELDSVTNYPFRNILVEFFLQRRSTADTYRALMSLFENYPLEHFYSIMNLLGSHDTPRILTVLGEAPKEHILTQRQKADFSLPAEQRLLGIKRLKLLVLVQMTFPGVPCIYYGDEAGAEGYGDPYNRGTYPWGREEGELLNWYKKLVNLRNDHDVLKTGEWIPVQAGPDIFCYLRRITEGRDVFGQPREDGLAVLLCHRGESGRKLLTLDLEKWCAGGVLVDVLNDDREYTLENGKLVVTLEPLAGKLLLKASGE